MATVDAQQDRKQECTTDKTNSKCVHRRSLLTRTAESPQATGARGEPGMANEAPLRATFDYAANKSVG